MKLINSSSQEDELRNLKKAIWEETSKVLWENKTFIEDFAKLNESNYQTIQTRLTTLESDVESAQEFGKSYTLDLD